MKIVIYSNTNWSEPPRLRHQVAELFYNNGHDVIFFERPVGLLKYLWRRIKGRSVVSKSLDDRVQLVESTFLIHHQLRVFPFLVKINELLELFSFVYAMKKLNFGSASKPSLINFRYDMTFFSRVKSRFGASCHIVNDDFIAQARFFNGRHVRSMMRKTFEGAQVLAVSHPLVDKLKFCATAKPFFPWASLEYINPKVKGIAGRKAILVWCQFTEYIDFDLIKKVAAERPEFRIDLVGPFTKAARKKLRLVMIQLPANVNLLPSCGINELAKDSYFCSLIPYLATCEYAQAVTVSNKTFQLMSLGIPIVTSGMSNFISIPNAISNAVSFEVLLSDLDFFYKHFSSCQIDIERVVCANSSESRYRQLLKVLSNENSQK